MALAFCCALLPPLETTQLLEQLLLERAEQAPLAVPPLASAPIAVAWVGP